MPAGGRAAIVCRRYLSTFPKLFLNNLPFTGGDFFAKRFSTMFPNGNTRQIMVEQAV